MSVAETILVYVVAPLAIVLLFAALIYLRGGRKRPRYKPGQPWPHDPVWYEPHPEGGVTLPHDDGLGHLAITTGSVKAAVADEVHRPVAAGPVGGARGTW